MARKAPFRERLQRHRAIATGRARRTFPNAAPKHPSVFFHMPKCGGTSLSEAMYATVPLNHRIGVIDAISTRRAAAILNFGKDDPRLCHEDLAEGQKVFDFREGLMLQHMAWDTMLIHGHLLWSEKADAHFGDTYKYVTLLRDPVGRTVSNFRMAQRTGVSDGDVDAYLESDLARRQSTVFLRYLAGRNDIAIDDVPEALALAKSRLEQFALIGFLDETDTFFERYKAIFGVPLRMAKLNAAPKQSSGFDADQVQRFEEICAPDITLFEYAKSLR